MSGTRASLLCLSVALTLLFAPLSTPSAAAQDFTQGMSYVSGSSALSWFSPNGYTAGYVILHYVRPGLSQQNINMVWNAGTGRWEFTITGLAAGNVVTYSFTYNKNGTQYDSAGF